MTDAKQITITRSFDAPASLVFECWTRPEHLLHWYSAGGGWTTPHAKSDGRAGGRFDIGFADPEGKMSFKPVLLSRARLELIEAWEWYEDKQIGLGDKFENEVYNTIDYIVHHPEHYPTRKRSYREAGVEITVDARHKPTRFEQLS